jgi:hypothetical protein
MRMRKLLVSAAISLLTLGLIFRLATRGVDTDARLWPLIRDASPSLLLAYLGCQLGQTFLRSERYRLLLRGCDEPVVPDSGHSFLVTLARNAMVDLLPARAGELGYLAVMNRGYRVGADTCLGAMAISLLLDMVALAALLAAAIAAPWTWRGASWRLLAGIAAGLVLVCVAGTLALFALLPRLAPPLLGWMERRRLPRAGAAHRGRPRRRRRRFDAALAFAGRVVEAVARVRHRRRVLTAALLLSLGLRLFKYGGLYALFVAVTRVHLPSLAGARAGHVLPALLAGEGAAGLPFPALMGFGAYEGGSTAVWAIMGFDAAAAAPAMLALHIVSQTCDYALGAVAGVLIAIRWRSAAGGGRAVARPRRTVRALPLLLLLPAVAVFAVVQWRALGKRGSLSPPGQGAAVAPDAAERQRLEDFAGRYRGRVVWSSNRHGNHDILLMELPSPAIRRLTTHRHTETFPRFSPDGRQVLFSRSQQPWVSQRNPVPWDTWVTEVATGRERLVATNAFAATWTRDGDGVVFQRDGRQVVLLSPADGRERLLFEAGRPPVPAGTLLQMPDYDARSGRLAVTLRGARRYVAVYTPAGEELKIAGRDHCQLAWLPDGALCSIGGGGRLKNAVYRHELEPRRDILWLDMPDPFSHEYFPRLSADGRVLLLGASAGGHEHDSADYEIFAWEPGTPPDAATRLTFHTGNDCWPDIWLQP